MVISTKMLAALDLPNVQPALDLTLLQASGENLGAQKAANLIVSAEFWNALASFVSAAFISSKAATSALVVRDACVTPAPRQITAALANLACEHLEQESARKHLRKQLA